MHPSVLHPSFPTASSTHPSPPQSHRLHALSCPASRPQPPLVACSIHPTEEPIHPSSHTSGSFQPPCCPRAVMGRRLAPGADCFLVAFEGGRGVGAADSTDELQVEGRPEVFGRELFVLAVPGRAESGRHVLRSATAGPSSGIVLSMPERSSKPHASRRPGKESDDAGAPPADVLLAVRGLARAPRESLLAAPTTVARSSNASCLLLARTNGASRGCAFDDAPAPAT